ncbi:hypothetical protein BDV28DRAFT_162005 [Aspergillus coremiiformis]|uniref:P-loop containing nucleoside triphosphate hydrolase protein n=1 Tax=Aspergillus coremiiformis TaxID=138285 RepID=A0A5N6Z2X9_9EURO|nr:hypothetical protein BDV28DRAFT_162005 [Aspergillus coremiiformis]
MGNELLQLAELHYVAEQRARHFRIWEDQGQQADYEGYLKTLYEDCFARMDQSIAETTISVPTNLDESFYLSGSQRDEDSDSDETISSVDGDIEMVDVENCLSLDPRENEDPRIRALESAVKTGVLALEKLRQLFEGTDVRMGDTDWNAEVANVLSYSQTEKVIIGVVGATGAGKSSLINAIVDEENILVTNCMRASTAVPTELSYNNGKSQYRAHIEFIQRNEWKRELRILFKELLDDCGDRVGGNIPKDSNGSIAWEKIKAVYTQLSLEDIAESSVKELLHDSNVSELLGSTVTIEENNARDFSRRLKCYIDSKGRTPSFGRTSQKGSDIALWPLIRVVRIFVKAKALSTGAVLVDLPGLFDSNPARVAVAEDYMKKCSAHWVISPINRAVDDKVARDLLGQNFRIQMQMDCGFNNITFVCTKTDEISISEVQDSLRLRVPSARVEKKLITRQQQLRNEVENLESEMNRLKDRIALTEDDTEEPEARHGERFWWPSYLTTSSKRKRHCSAGLSTAIGYKEPVPGIPSVDVLATETQNDSFSETDRLVRKYPSLQVEKETLDRHKQELHRQIQKKETEIKRLIEKRAGLQTNIIQECIGARNEFSKSEMKKDFVRGIRELDDEFQEDQDETTTPEAALPVRDYEKLKDELPIFCVSTKAYQKLRGRLRTELAVAGLTQLGDTEIPQLQRHCIGLTEKAREASALRFLTKLKQLFQSMSLWTLANGPLENLHQLETGFDFTVAKLKQKMTRQAHEHSDALHKIFAWNITDRLDQAVRHGSEVIPHIISRWNASRQDGGYSFHTYQATCRRRGIYKSMDFNKELANPFLDKIAGGWSVTFDVQVPLRLSQLAVDLGNCLQEFHRRVLKLAGKNLFTINDKNRLEMAVRTYRKSLGQELKTMEANISFEQRTMNRIFSRMIERELTPTYRECAKQKGRFSLTRIRDLMTHQARNNGDRILRSSTKKALQSIVDLLNTTEEAFEQIIEETVNRISRDYRIAIIDPQIQEFSNDQLPLQHEITEIIKTTEAKIHLNQLLELEKDTSNQPEPSPVSKPVIKPEEDL